MGYYPILNKNEIMTFARKCINLEGMILNKHTIRIVKETTCLSDMQILAYNVYMLISKQLYLWIEHIERRIINTECSLMCSCIYNTWCKSFECSLKVSHIFSAK